MTALEAMDEAIRALQTRVRWYTSHGSRSMRHGKTFIANRARAREALDVLRQVRSFTAARKRVR